MRIEFDLGQRTFQVGKPLLDGHVTAAEALAWPHSAIGCSGVFWSRSREQLHSTQVCGVSRRRV